jgi:hypothetical protein
MDKNVEQLLLAAGRMMDDSGGGHDWQAVIKASDVPQGVAERLVAQGLLRAHFEVGCADARTGLEDWHLTVTAREMVPEMILAEEQRPRGFGGKGWGRKGKGRK